MTASGSELHPIAFEAARLLAKVKDALDVNQVRDLEARLHAHDSDPERSMHAIISLGTVAVYARQQKKNGAAKQIEDLIRGTRAVVERWATGAVNRIQDAQRAQAKRLLRFMDQPVRSFSGAAPTGGISARLVIPNAALRRR